MIKLHKCIFIAKLLKQKGAMDRNEIDYELSSRWPEDDPLSRSTFARYKSFIEDILSCKIRFSQVTKKYSIEWQQKHRNNDLLNYIISMYDIEAAAAMILNHKDIIYHVDNISGSDKVYIILKAIDEKRGIQAEYSSFTNKTKKSRTFIPIFLSTWEGRWYCIAEVTTHPEDTPRVYALERFSNIRLTEQQYKPHYKGSKEEYFQDTYGIQGRSPKDKAIPILLKATEIQSEYLRMKPIHHSQKEIRTCQENGVNYTYFKFFLVPCYNFYQQLFWQRENIEIVSPQSVRDEMSKIAQAILEKYKK